MSGALRIGTRSSALALWQARRVAECISEQPGAPAVELVHIKTEGDVRTDVPLWAVDGRAFFTKEIDRALLASTVDIAVHSLKDLSTTIDPGIELAAVLQRENPHDALLSRNGARLADLPKGARVGTSSLRRRAFLAHARPDISPAELRGNVPTRLERLRNGDYDAIILATAGLKRLGLEEHITAYLPIEQFTPAVSQGAIGVCIRAGDAETARWVRALDDHAARLTTAAERALLRRIEGGCQVPVGALARLESGKLHLYAAVCALDGSEKLIGEASADATPENAEVLGIQVADDLLGRGAARIVNRERARAAARGVEAP